MSNLLTNRSTLHSLIPSVYQIMQNLELDEQILTKVQDNLDELLAIVNTATEHAKISNVETVSEERKKKRDKEKKKDKTVV